MKDSHLLFSRQDTFIESLKKKLGISKILILSFIVMITAGTLSLSMPFSNRIPGKLINHLFVATSAVCVTGLSPVTVIEQYTLFGQIVLIVLMQIGGIGLMTAAAYILTGGRKKAGFSELQVFAGAAGMENYDQVVKYIRSIVRYTLMFEGAGWILLTIGFLPEYSFFNALFRGLFLAVSAFTNAGFDILSSASLVPYQTNVIINLTVIYLIITGGLGFPVWMELFHRLKSGKHRRHLSAHARLVLRMTLILIISGVFFFLLLEWNNPETIGPLNVFEKVLVSFFQSVTLRTAGFMSVTIGSCTKAMRCLMIVYMLIGGSPGGTAGGLKTTTAAVFVLMVASAIQGNISNCNIFHRRIRRRDFIHASMVIGVYVGMLFLAVVLLFVTDGNTLDTFDLVYEASSAIATVGLSAGITSSLSTAGRIIIMLLMFAGRVGPVTIMALLRRNTVHKNLITYPDGDIVVG